MPDPQKLAWPSATPEQLEQAERLVNQPRRLQYFFERLNNPLWLAPLAARGWFDTDRVPEPIVGDDGSVQILDWPPAAYLARVAAAVPETAVSLIDAVGGTTNPLVQRHLVAALLALPPTQAAEFASLAVSWMRGPHAAWLDERDLTSLTAALLRLDDTNTGERLALALLSSIRDEYVLGEVAQALTQPLAGSSAAGVCVFAEALDQGGDDPRRWELINYGRVSIGDHPENQPFHGDVDPLIDGFRDAGLSYLRRTGRLDLLDELLARPPAIFRRIAYHLATVVINEADDTGQDTPPADWVTALRARARDWVMADGSLADSSSRLEYGLLVRAMLPHLSGADVETIAERVRVGPHLSDEHVQRLTALSGSSDDDAASAYADHWRAERLALFGAELPAPLQAIAEDLATRGVTMPAHPGLSHVTYPAIRPESPLSAAEVAAMSVENLVLWLADYSPTGSWPFDSPEESLADVIVQDIQSRPAEYTAQATQITTLPPLYISKLLTGLAAALSDTARKNYDEGEPPTLSLDWPTLLEASATIADLPDTGESDARHTPDSPRWLHRNLAHLIDTGLTVSVAGLTLDSADDILAVLTQLLDSPDPTPVDEGEDVATSDPTTRSINSVRGITMNAVMAFISWWCAHGGTEATAPAQLITLLDQHLDLEREPSPAIRSVYGQHIKLLDYYLPRWTSAHVPGIFGAPATAATAGQQQPDSTISRTREQQLGQVALDAYLLFAMPHAGMWDLMQPYYEQALRTLREPPRTRQGARRDTRQRLLDHMLLFVAWDVLKFDDPRLKPVFRSQWAGEAFMQLGFQLQHEESLDDVTAENLRTLWTWWRKRAESRDGDPGGAARMVSGFHRWWHAGKLGTAWEFEELLAVLRIAPRIEAPGMVIQDMVARYEGHEKEALEAIEIIVRHAATDQQRYYAVQKSEAILRALISSGDQDIRDLTRRFVQTLASWGMIEFAQKIGAAVA